MTARDLNRYGQLWLSNGTLEGHHYFTSKLKKEAWKYHGKRASDNGRYSLLWWLFEAEGGYVISGATSTVTAVVPESNIVITVMRNHIGPKPGPFNFFDDKRTIVLFGKRLNKVNPKSLLK
jgi:CubicO group peptidase (beta-lactamase class C family)